MDPIIQEKLERYMENARNQAGKPPLYPKAGLKPMRADGLTKVIRNKEEADAFMDQLNGLILLAKHKKLNRK